MGRFLHLSRVKQGWQSDFFVKLVAFPWFQQCSSKKCQPLTPHIFYEKLNGLD